MKRLSRYTGLLALLIGLVVALAGWRVRPVKALVNCCGAIAEEGGTGCTDIRYCSDSDLSIRECCYPANCRYDGTSVALSYCGSDTNVCCQASQCSSVCGNIAMWTWCRITGCLASADPDSLDCDYVYTYTTNSCHAGDTCYQGSSPYLYAALCLPNGCGIGGQYKTCCSTMTLSRTNQNRSSASSASSNRA